MTTTTPDTTVQPLGRHIANNWAWRKVTSLTETNVLRLSHTVTRQNAGKLTDTSFVSSLDDWEERRQLFLAELVVASKLHCVEVKVKQYRTQVVHVSVVDMKDACQLPAPSSSHQSTKVRHLTTSTDIGRYEVYHWWQFYCSERRYTDAYCIQPSPTAMVQNTHLPFFLGYGPKTSQSLTPMMTKFMMPHSSNSMSCNKAE